MGFLVRQLLQWASRPSSTTRKVVALSFGALGFAVLLPGTLIWILKHLTTRLPTLLPHRVEQCIGGPLLLFGVAFWMWAIITQWRIGHGTPVPAAPPQRLIVSGPYRLCRNPIQLGWIVYCFGLAMLLAGLAAGFGCCVIAFLAGSSYHKFVEEKELEARFGEDYREYRRRTPFLIPRFWK